MDQGKFQGALLGTFVGDALGKPIEGMERDRILSKFDGELREMKGSLLRMSKAGTYTDDTEMMIGLAEGLVGSGKVDCSVIASKFVDNFHIFRNYGPGTIRVIHALKKKGRWDGPAKRLFKGEGSYGNGSAMRIAPLGCVYYDMPDRIRPAAEDCSRITHAHPLGMEGGVIQAWAVAMVVGTDPRDVIDPLAFVDTLLKVTDKAEYVTRLESIKEFLRRDEPPGPFEVIDALGNDIRAFTAVPAAIYSFLRNWRSFEEAVVYGVNLGGDTDTIGAMAGALAGGLYGVGAIPERWSKALEDDDKGRSYVLELGKRLWEKKQISTF